MVIFDPDSKFKIVIQVSEDFLTFWITIHWQTFISKCGDLAIYIQFVIGITSADDMQHEFKFILDTDYEKL